VSSPRHEVTVGFVAIVVKVAVAVELASVVMVTSSGMGLAGRLAVLIAVVTQHVGDRRRRRRSSG
jgi:hypothetical protein